MKLADYIAEAAAHKSDVFGFSRGMSKTIAQAQRFDISDDVIAATTQLLQSRPSSLLAALPLCKMPYRTMWIEWNGGLIDFRTEQHKGRDEKAAPTPTREGMLVEEVTPRVGCITCAWAHNRNKFRDDRDDELFDGLKHLVNVSPIGIYFDFDGTDDLVRRINFLHARMCADRGSRYVKEMLDAWSDANSRLSLIKDKASNFLATTNIKAWRPLANDEKEKDAIVSLENTAKLGITPYAFMMAKEVIERGTVEEVLQHFKSWMDDIAGGAAIVRGILALLNTRNILTNEPEDVSRLNKARVKSGKRPVLPFTVTRLTMSVARTKAAGAAGMSREEARYHLVRGHFKIRKTGVYWWSPFPRGDPSRRVARKEYEVK